MKITSQFSVKISRVHSSIYRFALGIVLILCDLIGSSEGMSGDWMIPKRRNFKAIQPRSALLPSYNHRLRYHSDSHYCLRVKSAFVMLQDGRTFSEMFQLDNLEPGRTQCRWMAVVLLAVCSITISVATRFSVPGRTGDAKVTTVRNHVETEPIRQRLLENASSWIPPVIGSAILQEHESFTRVVWTDPPTLRIVFEESLFNRPPPSILL